MTKIILATTSPCRIKIFKSIGLDFIAEGSNVDEYFEGRPNHPKELVQHLAKLKAEAVAKNHRDGIIIGFDSVAYFNGEIIEKPKLREEAFNRIKKISQDKYHEYYTGIYMINKLTGKTLSETVKTEIWLRDLKDSEIRKYLDQDPNFNTIALGYHPSEFYSSTFISKIKGSYNNILSGLPSEVIIKMLFSIGYEL